MILKFPKLIFILSVAILCFNTSCKKDDDNVDLTNPLDFTFNYKVGDQTFSAGNIYTINGTKVQINIANFYIGEIKMQNTAGGTVDFKDEIRLVTPTSGNQGISTIANGTYNKVLFHIGVEPTLNSQMEDDFTSRDLTDPLGMQNPAMHWNWNTGYKFMRIDGLVDLDGDETPETALAFHIGSDDLLKDLSIETNTTTAAGRNNIDFTFDFEKLFDGVDFMTEYSTHTGNNLDLANKIVNNYSKAIRVE